MPNGRERTAAEREAARLERERRRTGASTTPPEAAPPRAPESAPPGPPDAAPAPPAQAAPAQPPDSPPAAPPPQFGDRSEPEPEPEPADEHGHTDEYENTDEYEHTDEYEQADDGQYTDEHEYTGEHEYADEHEYVDGHDDEAPAGTRRISALHRGPQRARPVRRRRPHLPGRRHSFRGRIAGLAALVLGVALIWFLVQLFQPFHGDGHGSVVVTVPPHTSAGDVADLLARDGVISSSFFFDLRATLAGDRSDLRSGTFHLKLDMPYSKVLSILTKAPPAAKVTELTLTEGRSRRQIDALLRRQNVRGSYLAATRHSPLLDPRRYGAPRSTASLEGFLFPSTYQLREPLQLDALVADQLNEFKKVFRHVNLAGARRAHLTPYDVLTIASMVEGEAQNEHDRGAVASVIYNRLRDGMPLQIDATSCYVQPREPCRLSTAALNSRSPYNTRIHKGLPPTPIGNPGLASIQAAANPPRTNYLYFVVKPCGNGKMLFTGNYQQFLKDAAQYQRARAQRGGRSPASCR